MDGDGDANGAVNTSLDAFSVESAPITYRWTADPIPCANCGEATRRLWGDGDRLVCPSCKGWSADGDDRG
jgi:hypothetical protein